MNTAFELFSKNGIGHTSISDIAEKAGVGKGTFYSYFRDKYDIHDHIVARKSAEIFSRAKLALDATTLSTLEDKIIFMINHIASQMEKDKVTLHFIYKNLSWGVFRNVLSNESDTGGVDFSAIFQKAIDESTVKYKDPLIMIYMIIELTSSICYNAILYCEPLPMEQMKSYLFDSVRAIMHAQEIKVNS